MNLKRLDLNLLTVFDAIMSERNMTRAAEKIGLTQPAISLAVSRLRATLDDPLFERTGRGVKPTPRALAMAAPVRRALDTITSALDASDEFDPAESDRTFRLVLNNYGELLYAPAIMRHLRDVGSDITIRTHPLLGLEPLSALRFGTVDLMCWLEPIIDEEISYQQIGTDNQVCLLREDHPLADRELTPEDYVALKHLTIRMPVQNGQTTVDQRVRGAGFERTVAMQVHSCHEMPPVIAETDLVATLPSRMAAKMADYYPLKVVDFPLNTPVPIYLMWHRSLDQDQGHSWLRGLITEIERDLSRA